MRAWLPQASIVLALDGILSFCETPEQLSRLIKATRGSTYIHSGG